MVAALPPKAMALRAAKRRSVVEAEQAAKAAKASRAAKAAELKAAAEAKQIKASAAAAEAETRLLELQRKQVGTDPPPTLHPPRSSSCRPCCT